MSECSLCQIKPSSFRRITVSFIATLAILASSLFIWGCAPEQKEGAKSVANISEEAQMALDSLGKGEDFETIEDHVTIPDIGNLDIDADVVLPEKWNPISYEVEQVEFAEMVTTSYARFLGANAKLEKEIKEDKWFYRWYANNDEDYLVGQTGSIGYSKHSENNGVGTFTFQPTTTLRDPYKEAELEGFSSAEATNSAKEALSTFGIDMLENIKVFAATEEALNESAQALAKDFEPGELEEDGLDPNYRYSKNDEFYVIFAPQILEGMPVAMNNYSSDSDNTSGTMIRVEVGRSGINNIMIDNYLQVVSPVDQEGVTPSTQPISLGEALKKLSSKYDQVLALDQIKIDLIALEYVPTYDKSLKTGKKVVPAWTFRDAENPDVSYRVNAVNGEIIV